MSEQIAVTDHNFADLSIEREILEDAGYSVHDLQAESEDDIIREVDNPVALLNQYETISERTFKELEELKVVGRYGIGVDTVDLPAATDRGIAVVNVPDYCIDEVAEHALALMLSYYRQIPRFDREFRAGEWDWKIGRPMHRFAGRNIGLVGFGQIPQRLAERLGGFDTRVLAFDPYVEEETMAEHGVEKVDFESLLNTADVISIHTPLNEETENLFDEAAFERMQEDAVIVNTSRGGVVQTADLIHAIEDDVIGGAALDVLAKEPPARDSKLRRLDDVIVTPHTAWYSEESIDNLRRTLAENIRRVLEGEAIDEIVNDVDLV